MNNPTSSQPDQDLAHLRPSAHDEIDLGKLIRNLIAKWKLILIITAVGGFASLFYVTTLTPMYRVEAILSEATLAQLGTAREQNLVSLNTADALQRTIKESTKTETVRQALRSSSLASTLRGETSEESYNYTSAANQLRSNLEISKVSYDYLQSSRDEAIPLTDVRISIQTAHPFDSVDFLTNLIEVSNRSAIEQFTFEVQQEKETQLKGFETEFTALAESAKDIREAQIQRLLESNSLAISKTQQRMETLLENAKADRLSRITQLKEAARTAESLGIVEPVSWDDLRQNQRNIQITNEVGQQSESNPLYFQGTRILSAEIDRLASRQDDRPFIEEYNQLARRVIDLKNDPEITALRNRNDDTIYSESFDKVMQEMADVNQQPTVFDQSSFIQITANPSASSTPVSPNKKLIVMAGIALSGMLALFVALILIALRNEET